MQTQSRVRPNVEARFGEIGRSIDELLDRSHAAETATKLRDEITKELKRIDARLASTRAQIDQDLATTRKDFVEAVRAELEVWKARVQELDLQAALGRMELTERLEPSFRRIQRRLARIKADLEALVETEPADEEALTTSIERSMKDLRREIETVDEIC